MPKRPKGNPLQISGPTRLEQPIILIRGFGGLGVEDEKRVAYQGFNDGTVYPHKRGENYIYEGMILRFMKSRWIYRDATNIVGFFGTPVTQSPALPVELSDLDPSFFANDKLVIDPAMALRLLTSEDDPLKTLWVFRYYDLDDREFPTYGRALVRLIKFIRALTQRQGHGITKVNIIAHSMGGLIVREALQKTFPALNQKGEEFINKIVTLGTPHQGISFQLLKHWIRIGAESELEHFNPEYQRDPSNAASYVNFHNHFPPERMLTVVGTNYRTYSNVAASWLNRVVSVDAEFGPSYNRSDGLVKQSLAQLPGAPRTFVHKCHGGPDSLVTSREAFEIATRFFFGNIKVRLKLVRAHVKRGQDFFGKSEFFLCVGVKPRGVDFELFHQSPEAENGYGPFSTADLSDKDIAFNWCDGTTGERLIWEGWLDTTARVSSGDRSKQDLVSATSRKKLREPEDIVVRLDFYLGERDIFGIGFSDNVVFRKQYYVRALFDDLEHSKLRGLELYTGEGFSTGEPGQSMRATSKGWEFDISGTGFDATFGLAFSLVPERGTARAYAPKRRAGHQK